MAKLELADILINAFTHADELAKATRVNSCSSYHLMRLWVSIGIFFVENNDEFQLTPLWKFLLTGTSDSLRGTILTKRDKGYQAWGNLLYTSKTEKTHFTRLLK